MLRAVLGVAVAVALVAAAAPAVDDARKASSDRDARRQADAVADAVRALPRESDPVASGVPGARRVVALDLPERSPASAGSTYLAVGGVPDGSVAEPPDGDVIVYRVDGGSRHVRSVPVDVRVRNGNGRTADDDIPLVLRDDATVVLRLVRSRGRPVVVASRREFKPETAARAGHVRTAGTAARRAGGVYLRGVVREKSPRCGRRRLPG